MICRLSVLATFLLLAILQVCAAFRPPVGRFKLSIKNMFLDAGGHYPGTLLVLKHGTTSTTWDLVPDGTIMDVKSGYFLGYTEEEEDARLVLTPEPVQWRTETLEKGLQITAPDCELVAGMLSFRIFPPFVGLTMQDKEGSQAWKLEPVLEPDPTPYVQDATFELELDGAFFGLLDPTSSSPVYLLPHPNLYTTWRLNKKGPDVYSIQNEQTGLFLSFNMHNLGEPLTISPEEYIFCLLKIDSNYVRILANILGIEPAVAKLAPDGPGRPPKVGLVDVHKVPDQKWTIQPPLYLDDSPRQNRLPFRRLRLW